MRTVNRWSTRLDEAVTALKASRKGGRSSAAVLRDHVPTVERQLKRCARYDGLISLWATSRNHDENVDGRIVAPEILRMIGDLVGCAPTNGTFHAGYLHTYGYLFSTLMTPFGLKRDRWIQPTLDAHFGFTKPTIRIHPHRGTLLMNLTWLLGSLVFDPDAEAQQHLDTFRSHVPESLRRVRRRRIRRDRIIERPRRTNVEILTDIVRLKPGHVLVYSVRHLDDDRHQLFTAFPIAEDFRTALLDPHRFGPGKTDLKLRFNAVIEGLERPRMRGERDLIQDA